MLSNVLIVVASDEIPMVHHYQTWLYFNEAKRWGATINLPCVNNSTFLTRIVDKDIFIGFIHIKQIEANVGKAIVYERELNGRFRSLNDFIFRNNTGIEQMIILIRIGAFRFTGKSKAVLLWELHSLLNKSKKTERTNTLFITPTKNYKLPNLEYSKIEDAFDEIELLEFPVSLSYFDLLKTNFRSKIKAKNLKSLKGSKIRIFGNLVTRKYVRTVKGQLMIFGTFLDQDGEFFDTIHFPASLSKYPFAGTGVYLIFGLVTEEFGVASITVEKFAKLPIQKDSRYK